MIYELAVALALALPLPLPAARTFTLEGVVHDRLMGDPIAGATVSLASAGRSVTTDEEGRFTFRLYQISGPDQLLIAHPDYETTRLALGDLTTGAWFLEVTMTQQPEVVGGIPPEEDPAR